MGAGFMYLTKYPCIFWLYPLINAKKTVFQRRLNLKAVGKFVLTEGRNQEKNKRQGIEMYTYQDILKSIIDNNDDMVFALDLDKRYLLFNAAHKGAMKKRYGVDIEEGIKMLNYIKDEMDIGVGYDIFERVAAGEIITLESEFDCNSIFRGHTALHVFPLKGNDAEIFGIAVFARNITKEMNLQMQNYYYGKMVEHIVSDLSHKLRKPVATILGLAQLMDSEKETADVKKIIGYLKETTDELDQCIKQMTRLLERKAGM